MGFFNKLKNNGKKVAKQNVLEAIVAACLLVAFSDGESSNEELEKTKALLENNESLSAFKPSEIQTLMEKYAALIGGSFRVGKLKLLREIADVSSDKEDAEEVLVTAISIAESDGTIADYELAILKEIAKELGLSLTSYGVG